MQPRTLLKNEGRKFVVGLVGAVFAIHEVHFGHQREVPPPSLAAPNRVRTCKPPLPLPQTASISQLLAVSRESLSHSGQRS